MNRFLILLGLLGALIFSWYSKQLHADRYGLIQYEAQCFIDPDDFFGDNEVFEMDLEGDLEQIIKDCRVLAQMRYKNNFSFALKELQPTSELRNREYTGICHIDYDAMIDLDKIVVGQLVANSVESLFSQCARLVHITYGHGTYAVNQVNLDRSLNYPISAECWVDDDAVYDPSHILIGRIYGFDISEMLSECRSVASKMYRYPFSAGLEDIQRNQSSAF